MRVHDGRGDNCTYEQEKSFSMNPVSGLDYLSFIFNRKYKCSVV